MNEPKYILLHCSDYPRGKSTNQVPLINQWHKVQDFPFSRLGYYVGYHAVVSNGQLYRTREDVEIGAHSNQSVDGKSMNVQSLGICWAGDGDIEQIPEEDAALIRKQVAEWMQKYRIPLERLDPHRKYAIGKTCPGSLIPDNYLRDLMNRPIKCPEQAENAEKLAEIQKLLDESKGWLTRLLEALRGYR